MNIKTVQNGENDNVKTSIPNNRNSNRLSVNSNMSALTKIIITSKPYNNGISQQNIDDLSLSQSRSLEKEFGDKL